MNKLSSKIRKELKGHGKSAVLFFITAGAAVYAGDRLPIYVGKAVDAIFDPQKFANHDVLITELILLLLVAAAGLFQWISGRVADKTVNRISAALRERVFRKMNRLPVALLDRQSSGDLLQRMVGDIREYTSGLFLGATILFTGLGTMIMTFLAMMKMEWRMAMMITVLTPLSVLVSRFVAQGIRKQVSRQAEDRAVLYGLLNEEVPNGKSVSSYAAENHFREKFKEKNHQLAEDSKKAVFFSSLVNPTGRFVNTLVFSVTIILGGLFIGRGWITVGVFSAFLIYANRFAKPFNDVASVFAEFEKAKASAKRVYEFLEWEEEQDSRNELKTIGDIEFNNVTFGYDASKPVLSKVSFEIKKGEHIAVVGPTGAGKTTILNLLLRFYDNPDGEIRLNGCRLEEFSKDSVRSKIGLVLQETFLKSGTIRENLQMGKEMSDSVLWEKMRLTGLDETVQALPDGLDTICDEGKISLSEGEKQLIAITRMMAANPEMIILDEATSSLDARSEMRIQNAIQELLKGRTAVIVAHRKSTIRRVDRIFEVRDRKVFELFSWDEIDSTASEARRRIESGVKTPFVILAQSQTNGRGRTGHTFYSPKGTGLYFNYAFLLPEDEDNLLRITAKTGVSVMKAIQRLTGLELQIKWVNDLFLDGKKVCGILTERIGDFISVGIGINLTTKDFPDELKEIAGSINSEELSGEKLLFEILKELNSELDHLENTDYLKLYRERSILIGREISFEENGRLYKGQCTGIDDCGRLQVFVGEEKKTLAGGIVRLS